ncbi:hypothetical protein DICPUDRAFT_92846 [Dictyostelium purpureum]|uniref:Uncharacterized protein n=1 Tax=Dictyostelium purpureum TaxID=5786 RepID=F0ZY43_DICPU|nr:uncharacterized protein DICPUDRAFT_92846 [Dictyostelium purpureum]EGC31142.1 hypothetical protein DICPUDRAFT_92846 [Dictyostelium purpureum]|eukprot:XP_003292330.1 hypothetical protein DICPUDRAFT_92846 [Dictyostelium purpureum]
MLSQFSTPTHSNQLSYSQPSVKSQIMFTPKKSSSLNNIFSTLEAEQQQQQQDEYENNNEEIFMLLCKDVPQLLSKQQFIGSTLQINKLTACDQFTKTFESSKTQLETAFKIDIEGPILPDTSIDLLKLFSYRYNEFQCNQMSHPVTYGFNFNNFKDNTNDSNSNNNNSIIEKSSKILDRNIISKINFNNNIYKITPKG